jgi:hypothetical protein
MQQVENFVAAFFKGFGPSIDDGLPASVDAKQTQTVTSHLTIKRKKLRNFSLLKRGQRRIVRVLSGAHPAMFRYCCKSPKLPGDNFPAVRRSD